VTGGEDETVAVEPGGVGRVVAQEAIPEDEGHGGRPQGEPRMAAVSLLDGIHRQEADGVDAELVEGRSGCGR